MLGWLKHKLNGVFIDMKRRQMVDWLAKLQTGAPDEVASVLVQATHVRNNLRAMWNVDLLDPILVYVSDPMVLLKLYQLTRSFQKAGQHGDAAGVMLWHFSMRAITDPSLRHLGRLLWRHVARAMPYADEAKHDFFLLSGIRLNIEGYYRFPVGLEPDRDGAVSDDHEAIVRKYHLAATQGVAEAQVMLGMSYAHGKHYLPAHLWFNLAAAKGDRDGIQGRDEIARMMTQAEIEEASLRWREWKPTPAR